MIPKAAAFSVGSWFKNKALERDIVSVRPSASGTIFLAPRPAGRGVALSRGPEDQFEAAFTWFQISRYLARRSTGCHQSTFCNVLGSDMPSSA